MSFYVPSNSIKADGGASDKDIKNLKPKQGTATLSFSLTMTNINGRTAPGVATIPDIT